MEFTSGDYIKFEIGDDRTGQSEWLWLRVDYCDISKKLVFGWLDSEPAVFTSSLKLGEHLVITYDTIRDHKRSDEF